jgi:hypothetical protein
VTGRRRDASRRPPSGDATPRSEAEILPQPEARQDRQSLTTVDDSRAAPMTSTGLKYLSGGLHASGGMVFANRIGVFQV